MKVQCLLMLRGFVKWVLPEMLRRGCKALRDLYKKKALPLDARVLNTRSWKTLWIKPAVDLSRQAQLQAWFQRGLRELVSAKDPDATRRVLRQSEVFALGPTGGSEAELALAAKFNANHKMNPVLYEGRALPGHGETLQMDVRSFLTPSDWHVQTFLRQLAISREGLDWDRIASNAQRAVCDFLRYVGDEVSILREEFWQFPYETLQLGTGDCEDGAILMASAMIAAGIPAHRVRVNAGLVLCGRNAETGGHAYVTYCRKSDNQWVILDWCYLPDTQTAIAAKTPHRDNVSYKDIWFSWNTQFTWSSEPISFATLKYGRKGALYATRNAAAG